MPLGVPRISGRESETSKLYRTDRESSRRSQSWMTCARVWIVGPQGQVRSSDGMNRR